MHDLETIRQIIAEQDKAADPERVTITDHETGETYEQDATRTDPVLDQVLARIRGEA